MLQRSDGGHQLPAVSGNVPPSAVNMDLTMCGLLVDRAAAIAERYAAEQSWPAVKDAWFDERLGERSTKDSSQGIFRVLSSRFKNAPPALPNPSSLPAIFEACNRPVERAQILYLYLIADDPLVRHVIQRVIEAQLTTSNPTLDFSNETLLGYLDELTYVDGSSFDYAESTTIRWCEGLRSVLREIGVIDSQQSTTGEVPRLREVPLLVAVGYSYAVADDEQHWHESPRGLQYFFQPADEWEEAFDRVAATDHWEYRTHHSGLALHPIDSPYGFSESLEEQ